MAPLRDFLCMDCNYEFEELVAPYEDDTKIGCPRCEGDRVEKMFPVTGGYQMDSGPSSVRPKGAGSRPKGSK